MSQELYVLQGSAEKAAGIHYEVDFNKLLGEGGMGRVFFGYRVDEKVSSRKEVAIKFLYDNLPPDIIVKARREASIQLHNDNLIEMFGLVELQDVDENNNPIERLHIVSEYLQGVTLEDLMNGCVTDVYGNKIPYAEELYNLYINDRSKFAINIIKPILLGVMALHDKGYIHRDIDPSNIMITIEDQIKLIDFGVARKINQLQKEHQGTLNGTLIGKAAYAAPEIALGDVKHHDVTTDIYALGILLFQLITGHVPFEGPTLDVMQTQIHTPMPMEEVTDECLHDIITVATNKLQKERFKSAAQFRAALDEYPNWRDPNAVIPQPEPQPQLQTNTPSMNPYRRGESGSVPTKIIERQGSTSGQPTVPLTSNPVDPANPSQNNGSTPVPPTPTPTYSSSTPKNSQGFGWTVWTGVAAVGLVLGTVVGYFVL